MHNVCRGFLDTRKSHLIPALWWAETSLWQGVLFLGGKRVLDSRKYQYTERSIGKFKLMVLHVQWITIHQTTAT